MLLLKRMLRNVFHGSWRLFTSFASRHRYDTWSLSHAFLISTLQFLFYFQVRRTVRRECEGAWSSRHRNELSVDCRSKQISRQLLLMLYGVTSKELMLSFRWDVLTHACVVDVLGCCYIERKCPRLAAVKTVCYCCEIISANARRIYEVAVRLLCP